MINTKTLKIKKEIYEKIIIHAKEDAPIEACGYLAGKDNIIIKHYKMTNADKSREHYSFLPEEQFIVLKDARKENLELMAVYHSHPESPARMSDEDIRLAVDPYISYLIISLKDKISVKSFRINNKEVSEEKLEVIL